ncbi:MAG TPA: TylF/MycF/NovP-related O-methyltransferase [Thermoleophilaceae bacterium]
MPVSLPSDVHPGLAAARPARAAGPLPDADSLRAAYLELLKLGLCDLCGTSTVSVGRSEDGSVWSREMSGDHLRLRAAGMDWPLTGLTMAGLNRLDDLQACVESVVRERVDGDLIEAGCWRGGASILMRAALDALGAEDRVVWVADSFEGFPEEQGEGALSLYDFLAVPEEEVRGNFERFGLGEGVSFVAGFFEQTLPPLSGRSWSLVRLDGDTYEATRVALRSLYPGLSPGGYLIVDDYGAFEDCRRAVDEFRSEHGIEEPIEEVDWTCVRWRRVNPAPLDVTPPPVRDAAPRAPSREREGHVPTVRELDLRKQISDLEKRLAAAEDLVNWLHGSPFRGARAWLRGLR